MYCARLPTAGGVRKEEPTQEGGFFFIHRNPSRRSDSNGRSAIRLDYHPKEWLAPFAPDTVVSSSVNAGNPLATPARTEPVGTVFCNNSATPEEKKCFHFPLPAPSAPTGPTRASP